MIFSLLSILLSTDPGAWPGQLDMLDLARGAGGHGTVIADAGGDRTARLGDTVPLDGCETAVPSDPSAIKFSWLQVDGPRETQILDAHQPLAGFVPTEPGVYRFRLTTRWHGDEDRAVVTIRVD